ELAAAPAGGDAADDRRAVLEHLLGVETALAPGDPLDQQTRALADQDRHLRRFLRQADDRLGRLERPGGGRELAALEQLETLLGPGAGHSDDDRDLDVHCAGRLEDSPGDLVAAGDAAEDVEQHALDVLVHQHDLERLADLVGPGAAADVEEVGRLAAGAVHQVEGHHRVAGPVPDDADLAAG